MHAIRVIILFLIIRGLKTVFIANSLGINRSTVYRIRKKYLLEQTTNFADRPRSKRKRKYTKEFEERLVTIVHISPRVFGYERNYWILKTLSNYMWKETGIKVSESTIYRILKSNKISCHRPKQRIHSPDPDYLEKKSKIEKMVNNPPEGSTVLYLDEHDAHLNPSIRRCWQKVGEQKKVYTPGKNEKLYIFGAYSPYEKKIVCWKIFGRKRSEEFFEFLKHLTKVFPQKKIILILDNFTIHKSKKLNKLIELNSDIKNRLEFVFLPTYAPELNPIERQWNTIKGRAESNYIFNDKEEFSIAVDNTLKNLYEETQLYCDDFDVNQKNLKSLVYV